MKKNKYYIRAAQLAAAHIDADKIRFITRDRDGTIRGWFDAGDRYVDRPYYSDLAGTWCWPIGASFVFGTLNIAEFYGRQAHLCIVDVKGSKETYLAAERPRKQNKSKYTWSKKND